MSFPLFDTIISETEDKDLTLVNKRLLIKKIEELDIEGMELIYALISHYNDKYKDGGNNLLPYEGKYINNDMTYDLECMPNRLKQLLFKFINMHKKRMDDELNLCIDKLHNLSIK